MLRDHWNSCVMQSASVSGPSPWAWASMAKTPCQRYELIMSEVVKSSASSGPIPPISRSADVRTA